MAVAMFFEGELCFASDADLALALTCLLAPGCALRPDDFVRHHLMLEVNVERVAALASWTPTLIALGSAAGHAWTGLVECRAHDGNGPEIVAATGLFAASRGGRPDRLRGVSQHWLAERDIQVEACADDFDFDDCRILVLYALADPDAEPDGFTPSFVVGTCEDDLSLTADLAPYITITSVAEGLVALNRDVADAPAGSTLHDALAAAIAFVLAARTPCLGYQLEPARYAGDGTARRRGLDVEQRPRPAD